MAGGSEVSASGVPSPAPGNSGHDRVPISPIDVPPDAAGVLLVGGVFDPPHVGHAQVAEAAREWLERQRSGRPAEAASAPRAAGASPSSPRYLPRAAQAGAGEETAGWWIVFVPAARSPTKSAAPRASEDDRLAMVRLMARGLPRATVWADEIERARIRPGPSFWIETLERVLEVLRDRVGTRPVGSGPGAASGAVRFLIGADQAAEFHRWREFRRILALAEPVVVLRDPLGTRERLIEALRTTGQWREDDLARWAAWTLDGPLVPVSATDVRALLARGVDDARLRSWLDPAVLAYIRRRGLYGPPRRA